MKIPSAYRSGYEKARALNPELAAKYVEHTAVGDPQADDVVDALASFDQREAHRFIQAGMEQDSKALADAPLALREFFERIETPPPWFDPDSVHAGCRAFHEYSDLFIPAFFVVTLQNAATLISKAFYMTGRVKTTHGLRRIRQNTRHFIEIMLPGALERHGEGWKLSVRIRLVHAQVRRFIRVSGNWDEAEFGVPLSAAHIGALFGQLLRNDAVAGRAARSASGRRVPCQLHADMALRLMVDRLAGAFFVRRRRIENRRAAPDRHRLRTASRRRIGRHRQRAGQRRASGGRRRRSGRAAENGTSRIPGLPCPARQRSGRSTAVSPAADGRAAGMVAVEARHPGGCPPAGPAHGRTLAREQFRLPARRFHDSRSQLPVAGSAGSGEDQSVVGLSVVGSPRLHSQHRTLRLDHGVEHPEPTSARSQPLRVHQLHRDPIVQPSPADRELDVEPL